MISHYKKIFKNPTQIFKILYHELDYNLIKFLLTYTTSYKVLNCIFNNTNLCNDKNMHSTIAAIISGCSYIFYSKYFISTLGLVTAAELVWFDYKQHNDEKMKINRIIKKIPVQTIIFCTTLTILIHARIHYPYSMPKLGKKFMSVVTNGQ